MTTYHRPVSNGGNPSNIDVSQNSALLLVQARNVKRV